MSLRLNVSWSRVFGAVVFLVAMAVAIPALCLALLLFGVWAGEAAAEASGLFTNHALRTILTAPSTAGRPLSQVVAARYSQSSWRSYHKDSITDVYVECEAKLPDGSPIKLRWFVKNRISWRHGLRVHTAAVSAINTAAYALAPQLLEPGRPIYGSADMAY